MDVVRPTGSIQHRSTSPITSPRARHRPAGTQPDLTIGVKSRVGHLSTERRPRASSSVSLGHGRDPNRARRPFHRTIVESSFIPEGTVSLYNGERWLDATPGDFLYLPPGGVHAFSNNSGAPVSMLDRPTETFVLTRGIVGEKLLACGKWR